MIVSPFRLMIVKLVRLLNVQVIAAKILQPLKKQLKAIRTFKPKSKKDFKTIGKYEVYKKLFAVVVFFICVGVILYFQLFAPPIPTPPSAPTSIVSSIDFEYSYIGLRDFSGVANVFSHGRH